MNNFAYTTVLTKAKYEVGAGRLYQSLKYFGSKYPLEILVANDIPEKDLPFLTKNNIPYKRVETLSFDTQEGRYPDTFSKAIPWLLTDYDYICFLDSDIILTKNIDYMFDRLDMSKTINWWLVWVEEKQRLHVCGGTYYFKPSKETYNHLIKVNDEIPNIHTDDELFYLAFFDSGQDVMIAQSTPKDELEYIHCSGEVKIWEIFDKDYGILYYWFYESPIEEFYSIMYRNKLDVFLKDLLRRYRMLRIELNKYNRNLKLK